MIVPRWSIVAVFAGVLVNASCSSRGVDEPTSLEGTYAATRQRSAATCSPKPLPVMLIADPAQYADVSQAASARLSTLHVGVTGSSVTIVIHDVNGAGASDQQLSGTLSDQAVVAGAGTQTEGPREGGHNFWVAAQTTDTANFFVLIGTPPIPSQRDVVIHGVETFTFREAMSSGAIFTTCVVPESTTASRSGS